MKFWKEKSWFPVLSVGFLLGLLVLLAGLQYKWLGQISDAERVRLESRLKDDTKRFAEDFNREIQTTYFNFQIDAEDFANQNWNAFNKRLIYWNSQTQFPELVKGFYFVKKDNSQTLLKFNAENRTFEKAVWTNDLTNINQKINAENELNPILEEQTALAIPVFKKDENIEQIIVRSKEIHSEKIKTESEIQLPEKYGFLIILLDENVIKDQIFPSLVSKYFSDTDNANYKISISDQKDQKIFQTSAESLDSPDSTAKFFTVKPTGFTFFRETGGDALVDSQVKNKVIYSEKFSTKAVTSDKNEILTVNIKGVDEEKPRIAVFESKGGNSDGLWTLNVQHNDGSLEQFIANTRYKNLAISFGILSLLAASVVLIFVSAQRSKKLAQRQLDFVSSVSHEFRTPLAVIYSAGENLTDGVVNSRNQVSKYGNLIKGEGKKLTAMVEQILQFAGARSGKQKYDFRQANVEEIIENALAECQPLIDEKEFKLEKEISEKLPAISADSNALSHAIQNLIINSIKYSNGNRQLKITARNGGGNLKISVEDNGIGISKKDLPHIFEPFYRSKIVVDEQIHGNGLGLSLVKQIIEAHKGKIKVESEIGKGSKFIVHLPLNI